MTLTSVTWSGGHFFGSLTDNPNSLPEIKAFMLPIISFATTITEKMFWAALFLHSREVNSKVSLLYNFAHVHDSLTIALGRHWRGIYRTIMELHHGLLVHLVKGTKERV